MLRHLIASAGLAGLLAATGAPPGAFAADLSDPPVFTSQRGTLDLVMVAGAVPTTIADRNNVAAWVYTVCPRTAPLQNACPDGSAHPFGGVRLQLNPGDTLRIRLVNKLPPNPDAKHIADNPLLIGNPTNLHTHGLIVEPHRAEGPKDPYGDYVFVELRNPENPIPSAAATTMPGHGAHAMGHPDMDVAYGAIDYAIQIPANHPSGHFWFHPHMHGVALNQVTSGLSGIITIGQPQDMCADAQCVAQVRAGNVRHLTLKDVQVMADGSINNQQEPTFCGDPPDGSPRGFCAGVNSDDGSFAGGGWYHTINGQVFPTIKVGASGDIWRILNSAGSRSYELSLGDDATGAPVLMQVLAIDGVPIDSLAMNAQGESAMAKLLAGKVRPVPCPKPAGYGGPGGLCTTTLRMMPSSRAEVRVVGQKSAGATLRTALFFTGGDSWPAIDLAHVAFSGGPVLPPLALGTQAGNAMSGTGGLMGPAELRPHGSFALAGVDAARNAASLPVTGDANPGNLMQAPSIAIDPDLKLGFRTSAQCTPLAPGHHRRIYFGNPTPGEDGFGLGYVEVDEKGREIVATRKPISVFDPTSTTVCVPLGAKGQAVKEIWELINLTDEDHNFHIHQTRFRLLQGGTVPGTVLPTNTPDGLVLHDNVPLPRAAVTDNCDGTTDAFLSGACKPNTVVVEIPFHEIGDFVFHCHILEHEDGGMMARIRVVAPP
ncbi:MAG TPA: multicopper oxidase domain-containing protein, partial [Acetobacteraceae bacterium]|nr:multicopper oxidase domain-containing protein [Acetobacteraceae bacterium]